MRILIIACLCLFFVGCKNKVKEENISDEKLDVAVDTMLKNVSDNHWSILGTEPFWHIYIHKDTILFTKLNEKVDTVYFRQDKFNSISSNSNYELIDSDKIKATLNIKQEECSDGMSDKTYQYSATFKYKDAELKGCAEKK